MKTSIYTKNYHQNGQLKNVFTITEKEKSEKTGHILIPKWSFFFISLGFIFIFGIFASVLTIIHVAPRAGLYNETCEHRSCLASLDLKCINNTCQCNDGYFYTTKCELKKNYLKYCYSQDSCYNNKKMYCIDGVCKCNETNYYNGSTCLKRKTFNEAATNQNQCLDGTFLIYNETLKKCLCDETRFWDGYACVLKRTFGEKCQSISQCQPNLNLICYNDSCQCNSSQYWLNGCMNKLVEDEVCTNSSQCLSIMNCTSSVCKCPNLYYFDNSTLQCVQQLTFGQSCTLPQQCQAINLLDCLNTVCNCSFGYWSSNTCILDTISTYSGPCNTNNDCNSTQNLICLQNSANNCKCPSNLSAKKCDCLRLYNNEFYWANDSCVAAKSYGQSCITNYTCKTITENTYCVNGFCNCTSNLNWNGTACNPITCKSGWTSFGGKCYKYSLNRATLFATPYSPNQTNILTTCGAGSVTNAKLATLTANLLTQICASNCLLPLTDDYYIDGYNYFGIFKSYDQTISYPSTLIYDFNVGSCLRINMSATVVYYGTSCMKTYKLFCEYTP